MDETELREILMARATRGETVGADATVDAVALTLRPPKPPRRRQRLVFALAMVAAVVVSVGVLTARGTDRVGPSSPVHTQSPTPTTSITTPAEGAITSVHAIDGEHAWVVTDDRVLATNDQGRHWTVVANRAGALAGSRRAAFASASDGIVLSEDHAVVRVTRLHQQRAVSTIVLADMRAGGNAVEITHAADEYVVTLRDACAAACRNRIFTSADGARWTRTFDGAIDLTGLRCTLHGNCWAFASDLEESPGVPALLRTVDDGRTWTRLDVPIPASAGAPVAARVVTALDTAFAYEVDDLRAGAATVTPVLVVSDDAGRTWQQRVWPTNAAPTTREGLRLRVFRSASARWIATVGRVVMRADTDALQWRAQVDPLPFVVTMASWADASTAWVAGASAGSRSDAAGGARQIAYTTDAGRTWHDVAPLSR